MVYTITHRQRASICWSFISINIGLSCKRLVSWNHDNKNQPLSRSWHVRQVWSISTPSLVLTLNTADIFIATVTEYYVLDDVFICLHSTTKINFKFVSPLLFKILDHNVISITIAIVRMKEKENVKNSGNCNFSNDATMQVACYIIIKWKQFTSSW